MSCGLGAIILVFMMVKYESSTVSFDLDGLQEDLARLNEIEAELNRELADASSETAALSRVVTGLSSRIEETRQELVGKQDAVRALEEAKRELASSLEFPEQQQQADPIELSGSGEEDYLIGLKVEGERIAILIDASTSMTDIALIDILKRKASPPQVRRQGPKWQRTIRIARWLLARVPETSEVVVQAFSDRTHSLGPQTYFNGGDANALADVVRDLDVLDPLGPTNLAAGLAGIRKHRPTNVYILTDGLPTTGNSNYAGLNPFASCQSLISRATMISGECREKLAIHTIADAKLGRTKVNIVLLPLEGDPRSPVSFWQWTGSTGGLLMAPAETWP